MIAAGLGIFSSPGLEPGAERRRLKMPVVVRPGDHLVRIGRRFGSSFDKLLKTRAAALAPFGLETKKTEVAKPVFKEVFRAALSDLRIVGQH